MKLYDTINFKEVDVTVKDLVEVYCDPDMSGTIERIEYQINMLIWLVSQIVEASPELVERLIDTQWRYRRPKE